MKIFVSILVAMAVPGAALAHGGHPEVGDHHALAHLMYFGIPLVCVGIVSALIMGNDRQQIDFTPVLR